MRLSESLRRDIMETAVGGIINKFKFKRRRTTLFFEDILAEYIKACEDAGYSDKMREIGELWGALGTKQLGVPTVFLSIALLNYMVRTVGSNLGLFDEFNITLKENIVSIKTKNEFITRLIGNNEFMTGVFKGCISSYFKKRLKFIKAEADKYEAEYILEFVGEMYDLQCRDKRTYDALNALPDKRGFALKDALKNHIFTLKGNRIYFREKSIIPIENTVFHIIGNENILMDDLSAMAYDFFREIIDKDASPEKKLTLLKTLLQVMGWCRVNISYNRKEIIMKMNYVPSGLQTENNNWKFLIMTIAGYMRTIDTKLNIEKITQTDNGICVVFSKANEKLAKSQEKPET